MKQIGKIIPIDKLYLIGISLYFCSYWLEQIYTGFNKWPFALLAFFLLLIKGVYTKYTLKEIIIYSIFFLICITSFLSSMNASIIWTFLIIISAKGMELKKVITSILVVSIIILLTTIIMALFGLAGPVSITMDYGRGGIETRYYLGFRHANQLFIIITLITTGILYLGYESRRFNAICAVLFVFLILLFILAKSKTGLFCCGFEIILLLLRKNVNGIVKDKIIFAFIICFLMGFILVTTISVYIYSDSGLIKVLDKLLTGRIRIANTYLTEYPLSIWGQKLNCEMAFDMGFIKGALEYGILAIGGVVAGLIYQIRMLKRNNLVLLICYCSFILVMVVEDVVFTSFYNWIILTIGCTIYFGQNEEEEYLYNALKLVRKENT